MTKLVLQMDVRLRKLGDDGLEDLVATHCHFDLPAEAAGGNWRQGQAETVEARCWEWFVNHLGNTLPDLIDHCQWEQAGLPFE